MNIEFPVHARRVISSLKDPSWVGEMLEEIFFVMENTNSNKTRSLLCFLYFRNLHQFGTAYDTTPILLVWSLNHLRFINILSAIQLVQLQDTT